MMQPKNRTSHQSVHPGPSSWTASGRPVIIVHGGAGNIPEDLHRESLYGCREAAQAGWDLLARGGTAVDAVEAAVRLLEDAPVFDAGRGSVLNASGDIEMDAIIMDGRDLNLGAVIAVKRVHHPVSLARIVMTASKHTMLAGEGAETFAREHGVPLRPSWELIVNREAERWLSNRQSLLQADAVSEDRSSPIAQGDTVGAVALDVEGHLAAATSTGGTFNKHPGRVGDSPLVGCGAYVDDRSGAASATGDGEELMKIVISKVVCEHLDRGMTALEAAEAAIALLTERTVGQGGIIVLDRKGGIGIAHSTSYLAYACVTPDGELLADIHASLMPW